MSNIQQNIFDAMSIIADKKINEIKFDKTIECTILPSPKADSGEYQAKYQDIIIKVYSNVNTIKYSEKTNVYVLVPQGDFANKKTIIGKVEASGEEYFDINNILDKIEILEGNYVDEPVGSIFEDFTIGKNSKRELKFKNEDFIRDYPNKLNLLIGATIKTKLPKVSGDFGLILDLTYENDIRHEYKLSMSSITGNPYSLEGQYQYKVFPLFISKVKRVNGMYLYINGFEREMEGKSISFSNVEVSFAKPKDAEDLDSFSGRIHMEKGNIFKNGLLIKEDSLKDNTLTLEMILEKKSKKFKPNAVYKWFYADSTIRNGQEGWDSDGGDGWHKIVVPKEKILDNIKPQEEGMKLSEDGSILTITPIAVPNIETFKCVAIFGGEKIDLGNGKYQTMGVVKVDANATVVDQSDPIVVTILSTRGDVFKPGDGIESTELVCKVFQGLDLVPPDQLLYSWGKYINDGKNIEYIKVLDPSEKLTVSNINGIINTESYVCEVYKK